MEKSVEEAHLRDTDFFESTFGPVFVNLNETKYS